MPNKYKVYQTDKGWEVAQWSETNQNWWYHSVQQGYWPYEEVAKQWARNHAGQHGAKFVG